MKAGTRSCRVYKGQHPFAGILGRSRESILIFPWTWMYEGLVFKTDIFALSTFQYSVVVSIHDRCLLQYGLNNLFSFKDVCYYLVVSIYFFFDSVAVYGDKMGRRSFCAQSRLAEKFGLACISDFGSDSVRYCKNQAIRH